MAQPTNTFSSYGAVGNREDLSDLIYNVSPTDYPFQAMCGKRQKVSATYTEWQTDSLAAVDLNNAVIEGDDATHDAINPTVRVGNYVQTSDKTAVVTTIQDSAVDKAGRKREMGYAIIKKTAELKRDMEAILTQNQAAVAGANITARRLRSLEAWYATNVSRGATGANGSTSAAATDGTQRNLSETLIKTVMQSCYTNGGAPSVLMVGPVNRVNVSSQITGGATKFDKTEDSKVFGSVKVYDTDFGELKVVANRFQRDRTAHLLDPKYVAIGELEPVQGQELATTGLTRRKQIWGSYTLIMKNEAAHGVIADLNTAIL